MRQEVQLFLGGQEVQFNEPPEILFSYIRTDYTDPTVLRNSYSKTLTIEGTPNNNALFNGIYHLDKISDYGTFNPAKRMGFQLFANGDILEQGYAKLDKINKDGKNISYDITLYGGLGEFLYNLSYDQTAEGSDTSRGGGEDRRLSSLIYYDANKPNQEFDFDITKETVAEAWEALEKGTGATKWQYINFAPAYNGYPEDFDADKVLINTQNSSCPVTINNNGTTSAVTGFPSSLKQGDQTYRAYNNYAIGELPKEMTEWEMRDLRSYMQRPVLSMKGFINAISNPTNNGGYEVELDPTFFDDSNPYYSKAWVTLPLLKKDETVTGQSAKTEALNDVLSVSSSMGDDYDVRYYLQGLQPGAVYNGIELNFSFNVNMSGMPNEVYTTVYDTDIGFWNKDAGYYSSIFVQLVGEDENGNAIAGSPIYNFTSPYAKDKSWWFFGVKAFNSSYQGEYTTKDDFDYTPSFNASYVDKLGCFVKTTGDNYVWKSKDGNQSVFSASLDDRLEYARVYFRVTKCYKWRDYKKNSSDRNLNCFEEQIFSGYTDSEEKARNILGGYKTRTLHRCSEGGSLGATFTTDSITARTAVTQTQIVGSQVKYTVASDVVRSGDHISKGDLLNFDGTPCDYLLSYCKLFNLYLSKDTYEKKIYIRTRDSFYNGGTIDLDKFIDRSKDIKVQPLAMESRWYDFAYPEDEKCGAAEDYDFNYGVEYGKNKVQTTYEFDSAAKNLFDDNIYQNGVQVQESSKFYTVRTVSAKTVPTFLYNSIEYKLFNTPNDALSSCYILPPSGYTQTGYTSADSKEDWLPKLQLNNGNDSIDGQNVLCFYGGFKSSPYVGGQQAIYYLTDDLAEMYVLNGETPCWLWTLKEKNNDQQIAKGMTKLPIFSRMLYTTQNTTGTTDTKIAFTWDFGRVRNTYVPVKNYIDKATIYERWWADYIADLYDYNTRVVEAYVKMEGKVVGDWLRAMYWWDNCYWVLTEINDYNITSYNTTKCKFVKVNDISNYTSGITPPTQQTPTATLVPSKYMIAASGETITAVVKTSDGGPWHIEYPSYVHPSQVAGTGDTSITLRFDANPNSDGRDFNISAYRTVGTPTHFWQEGTESVNKQLWVSYKYYVTTGEETSYNDLVKYKNRGNDTVTVTSNADWVTVEEALAWNGDVGQIKFHIADYTGTTDVRSATITFTSVNNPSFSDTLVIDQVPKTIYFGGNGGTTTLHFLSSQIEVAVDSGYWAEYTTTDHTATFTAPANLSVQTRTERVRFRWRGTVDGQFVTNEGAFMTLQQDGGGSDLKVEPDVLYFNTEGGGKYVTVTCSNSWAVTSKPEWVTLTSMDGSPGSTMLLVTANESEEPYSRTGEIIFSDGRGTATLTLQQLGNSTVRALSANPQTVMAISNPSSYTVDVFYANRNGDFVSMTPSETVDWYSASTISWTGDTGRFTLYVADNESVDARSISLVLSAITGEVSTTVVLQQAGDTPYINLVPSAMTFDATGGTKTLTADSNVPWDIDIDDNQ